MSESPGRLGRAVWLLGYAIPSHATLTGLSLVIKIVGYFQVRGPGDWRWRRTDTGVSRPAGRAAAASGRRPRAAPRLPK